MEAQNVVSNTSVPGKVYAAIANVIADCGHVGKDKVNKQQGFKYRSVDDVFNALHPALAKNKVIIVPNVLERTCEEVGTTKNGSSIIKVVCKVRYDICAEDGSHVSSVIYGEGMDMGDKATNKAMAIAYKYLCFQIFCIPTEEMADPDAESLEGEIENPKKPESKKDAKKSEAASEASRPEGNTKITEAMLRSIKAEQMRTGVTDQQILGMKAVSAKSISELTVLEYKSIMSKFEKTPDLAGGAKHE